MADPFRKVISGEPLRIPAEGWNACVDAAQAHKQGRLVAGGPDGQARLARDEILIRNDTGGDLDRFSILNFDGLVFAPADNLVAFKNGPPVIKGVKPDETLVGWQIQFAVTMEPLADGKIGRAAVGGIVAAQVNVIHENDTHVNLRDDDETKFDSNLAGGGRILAKEAGTGDKWAYVQLGAWDGCIVHGTLDDALEDLSSATLSVTDSTRNLTVHDHGTIATDWELPSGAKCDVYLHCDDVKWYPLTSGSCQEETE